MTKAEELPIALIVVANRLKSSQLKKALRDYFNIFEIQESFGAVDWLKHFQASVIILDEEALSKTWPMFVEHIRKLPDYAEVPILLISNNLKKTFLAQALTYGITDFLLEPLEVGEIYQRILVNMKTVPITKRVSLLTKKIARSPLQQIGFTYPRPFFVTEEVIKRISQSRTHQLPLALIMIELDGFATLDEQLSSEEKEELYNTLNAIIQMHLRKNDFLLPQNNARFLLIFPLTSERAAVSIAEMIRKEVESTSFVLKNHTPSITLSMGLIAFDKDSSLKRNIYDQFEMLLEKVDRALTEAKDQGNKIVTKRTI